MLPPHDPNAEAAVLGSLLIDPDAYYEVSDILTPEAFYQAGHRWLYEAIQSLSARQEPPDILAIANELTRAGRLEEAGGLDRIVTLLNSVPTSINAEVYARIVADKATRRRLIHAAEKIAKAAYNEATPIHDVRAAAEAAVLAQAAGLPVTTISGQLTRLEGEGLVDKVRLPGARRNGYRTRNGAAQAHFDRYMETLQA